MDGATLSTVADNLNLNLSPNGAGKVVLGSAAVVDDLTLDGSEISFSAAIASPSDNIVLTPTGAGKVLLENAASVGNLNLDGNTLSSAAGDINLVPAAGFEVQVTSAAVVQDLRLEGRSDLHP